ncbi:MAG: pre-16S rRNA-processing nuclease YqgF [Actinobacteria bacterium]|nr:MAG: pre-16S rRNA-processing nuclease YqgF [Actinomycetota bacterium]
MKIVAVDYGSARTGIAVSDPTGTLARPVGVIERAGTTAGLERLVELIASDTLRRAIDVPVEGFDERFTTDLAEQDPGSRNLPPDARAAAHLLTSYLAWSSRGAE